MKKNLPKPPQLKSVIGPSFILLGLALGSGELIMWPYLTSRYGLGLIWGAVLGISGQFLLNLEAIRYSLCWGESVFVGFWRLWRRWPIWFIISTFIPWSLPGFSSGVSQIIGRMLGLKSDLWLSVSLLLLAGVILSTGRSLYRTMEFFQRMMIIIGLPLVLLLVLVFVSARDIGQLAVGLVGIGEGFWLVPAGISWAGFLAAIAYAGAGGNLNLAQSYYVKEKGFGMGKFGAKINSLWGSRNSKAELTGERFKVTLFNRKRFGDWWRLCWQEHGLVFWLLGLLTILLLALLAYILAYGRSNPAGLEFLFTEGEILAGSLSKFFQVAFWLMAAGMLFSTQIGVLEASSRIISENAVLLKYWDGKKVNLSWFFYLALWLQIGWGIVALFIGWREPKMLLTLSAILNAFAMAVSFPLLWWLNRSQLPCFSRPGKLLQVLYGLAFAFLVFFCGVVLVSSLH